MRFLAITVLLITFSNPAPATVVYSEPSNGTLSSSGTAPTQIPLNLGVNSIVSTFGGSTQFDYFSFTLAHRTEP